MMLFLHTLKLKDKVKEKALKEKKNYIPVTTMQPAAWSHIFSRYPLWGNRKYIAPSPLDSAPYFAWLSILTGGALTPSFCWWINHNVIGISAGKAINTRERKRARKNRKTNSNMVDGRL